MYQAKTWLFMGILSIFLVFVGRFVGGSRGMLLFFAFSVLLNVFAYWTSGATAIMMTRSRPVSETELPQLYTTIRHLSDEAGIPMPQIYLTPSQQPNAFATGRNPKHAKVAVTEGILQALPPRELAGVLAHELAHIKSRDILISSMAAVLAGAITSIANVLQWGMWFGMGNRDERDNGGWAAELLTVILAPIAATVVQLAISRSREYHADAMGARILGDPNALADALESLETYSQRIPSNFNPAMSHMFIVNPFRGQSVMQWFSTHPPTAERVRRLRTMIV